MCQRFQKDDPDSRCAHWLTLLCKVGKKKSMANALFGLAEQANLASRFTTRLAAAFPFDPDDPTMETVFLTVIEGLDAQQMMTRLIGRFPTKDVEENRVGLLETHKRLTELSELRPLLSISSGDSNCTGAAPKARRIR